jgi:hypothetical protein
MGLFELFNPDVPQRQNAQLDPTSQGLINKSTSDALGNDASAQKAIGGDISAGTDALNQGFAGGGFDQALKQKYSGLLGSQMAQLANNETLGSKFQTVQRSQRAMSALIAKQKIDNTIFSNQLEAQRMQEAARSQTLISILGFGGSIAGYNIAKNNKQQDNALIHVDNSSDSEPPIVKGMKYGQNPFGAKSDMMGNYGSSSGSGKGY